MDIDTIPPGCEPEFVGEGAANVVFAIKPPSTSPSHSSFQGKGPLPSIPHHAAQSH